MGSPGRPGGQREDGPDVGAAVDRRLPRSPVRVVSNARVLIEHSETPYNQEQGERSPERDRTLLDAEAVQSQVQLALSRDLARTIVRDLKFAERPEFNPNAGGSIMDGVSKSHSQ